MDDQLDHSRNQTRPSPRRSRYWPSLRSTVWLDQIESGFTHASSVSRLVGLSEAADGTRT